MAQATSAQAAQTGLVAALTADLQRVWASFDLSAPDWSRLFTLITALIHRYGQASAGLAVRYYLDERRAAGIGAPFRIATAPLPPLDQIGATLGWATTPLQTGDLQLAQTNTAGAVDRLVLDVGRRTITDAVRSDREAHGWARITRPGACSFCRLLATRGAVYKSAQTAGGGSFKFHNHCHCYVEPLFSTHYEPTAQARADLALYREVTGGKSGADARNAFRQAVEAAARSGPDTPGG